MHVWKLSNLLILTNYRCLHVKRIDTVQQVADLKFNVMVAVFFNFARYSFSVYINLNHLSFLALVCVVEECWNWLRMNLCMEQCLEYSHRDPVLSNSIKLLHQLIFKYPCVQAGPQVEKYPFVILFLLSYKNSSFRKCSYPGFWPVHHVYQKHSIVMHKEWNYMRKVILTHEKQFKKIWFFRWQTVASHLKAIYLEIDDSDT